MGDLKVVAVLGLIVIAVAFAAAIIIKLLPFILLGAVIFAIARMLDRQSSRKDETHSPGGPGQK